MIDWTNIYTVYKGKWVALKDDEETVVGAGATITEALQAAETQGYKNPIVMFVPEEVIAFAGLFYEVSVQEDCAWS